MPYAPEAQIEQESVEEVTLGLLFDAEKDAAGDPDKILMLGNSMLAAARLMFARANIDEKTRADLYRDFWRPLVLEGAPL